MSGFRFTIAGFFLVLTLVALGLAALVSQSPLAGSAAYTGLVVLLCLAAAGAILRPMPQRAFWLGLALFGWTYWFVEFETEPTAPRAAMLGGWPFASSSDVTGSGPGLVSRQLLHYFVNNMTPSREIGSKVMGRWRGGTFYSGTITQANGDQYLIIWDDGSAPQWTPNSQILPNSPSVLIAGHSLANGLFALFGAVLAAALFGGPAADRKSASSAAAA